MKDLDLNTVGVNKNKKIKIKIKNVSPPIKNEVFPVVCSACGMGGNQEDDCWQKLTCRECGKSVTQPKSVTK